jgi:hypothetical protein
VTDVYLSKICPSQPKWKFHTDGSKRSKSVCKVPGPCDYTIASMLGNGPKHSLGAKLKCQDTDNKVPGPGKYEPKYIPDKDFSSFIGIGKGEKLASIEEKYKKVVPGPGSYIQGSPSDGPKYK